MKLTHEEANALGLGHLWPAEPKPPTGAVKDGYNKLERGFRDRVLIPGVERGVLTAWWREPIKLALAGRCWYTPDFLVAVADPATGCVAPVFVELKGHMRDDASVKMKVAARAYPLFGWLLIYRRDGHWLCHTVTAKTGISRGNVILPWIHGIGGPGCSS